MELAGNETHRQQPTRKGRSMITQDTIRTAIETGAADAGRAVTASLSDLVAAVARQIEAGGGRRAAGKVSIVVILDQAGDKLSPTVRVTAPGVAYKAEYSHDDLADYPELPGLGAGQ